MCLLIVAQIGEIQDWRCRGLCCLSVVGWIVMVVLVVVLGGGSLVVLVEALLRSSFRRPTVREWISSSVVLLVTAMTSGGTIETDSRRHLLGLTAMARCIGSVAVLELDPCSLLVSTHRFARGSVRLHPRIRRRL